MQSEVDVNLTNFACFSRVLIGLSFTRYFCCL